MTIRPGMKAWITVQFFVAITLIAVPSQAETISFQQGVNGYDRAQDTGIRWAYTTNFGDTANYDNPHAGDPGEYEMWSTGAGRSSILEVGQFYLRTLGSVDSARRSIEAGPSYRYSRMYIRFRDVFGTGAGQIAPDAEIASATLKLFNTEDLGTVGSSGGAAENDPTCCDPITGGSLANPQAQPKLNAGNIAIYPSLIPIAYGFDDGTASKGKVTAKEKRRGREFWARGKNAHSQTPNDPLAQGFKFGPADWDDPDINPGEEEIDSRHPGAIEIFQNTSEGFKEFDVSGLMDFITGSGVFITALSPEGELPTLDINYGNAYRSSEFGDVYDRDGNLISGASAADIATRPMLVIELGSSAIPGDVNSDGVVDVADLGVVGANFGGTNATANDGDLNGDGQVDVADLGIVGANWTAAATGSITMLVPEPGSVVVLTLGLAYLSRRRCEHNRHRPQS